MKVIIEKRFSSDTLIEGEAESRKDFVVKNKSDLSGSDLRGSDLRGSNLSGSDLSGSDLSGSDLRGSNLSGSDLRGSDLRYAKIKSSQKDVLLKALRIEIID